jgi:gliding motility-associated-like protein
VDVVNNFFTQKTTNICDGDSVYLANAFQHVGGFYMDTLSSTTGCDSILETQLLVLKPDTTYFNGTSCDASQAGQFIEIHMNQWGCDSTTITTIIYVIADTTLLQTETCIPQEVGIFTDYFIAQNGCDSVVIETIVLVPSDTTLLSGETCDPTLSGIFSNTFLNSDGCDSLVIETITLLPSNNFVTTFFSCLPGDTGTVVLTLQNQFGCDSVLMSTTYLSLSDTCFETPIPKHVFIPNIFSPNLDGINDIFMIFSNPGGVSRIPLLRIFDRWGGLVFERYNFLPNDPQMGWDGTERGKMLQPGVFVWMIEIEYYDGKNESRSGNVTLVR